MILAARFSLESEGGVLGQLLEWRDSRDNSLGRMWGCAQEAASGPLKPRLALLWESDGVYTRKGIRTAPADHVRSYYLDRVSIRRNEDYPEGGGV